MGVGFLFGGDEHVLKLWFGSHNSLKVEKNGVYTSIVSESSVGQL